MSINRKKLLQKAGWTVALLFVLLNVMAFLHARRFTHFNPGISVRKDPSKAPFPEKVRILFTGLDLPRPVNRRCPDRPYTTVVLQSNVPVSCWEMQAAGNKGTVVLCHGYGGERSSMLDRAYVFLDAGYNVLLPDFMGSGASGGNTCTIGFKEAENVKACVTYLAGKGEPVYLMGVSMGAAAIMRAASREALPVKALILECPFGSMRQTVKNRFEMVGLPSVPLADLLVFWGGVQNGFNAFSHDPEAYASGIRLPVLLQYGAKDDRVKRFETDRIYNRLAGPRSLVIYPQAGHESYLDRYRQAWTRNVLSFLAKYP